LQADFPTAAKRYKVNIQSAIYAGSSFNKIQNRLSKIAWLKPYNYFIFSLIGDMNGKISILASDSGQILLTFGS